MPLFEGGIIGEIRKRKEQRKTDEFKDAFLAKLAQAGADEVTLETLSTIKADSPEKLMTTIKSVQDIVSNTDFGVARQIRNKAAEASATEVAKKEVGLAYRPKELKVELDAKLEETRRLDEAKFGTQTERFQRAGDIRQDFVKASDDFVKIRDSYAKVKSAALNPKSPAANLSMIFNYMKILDPASTVREGEQATARNATGIPDRIRGLYNKLIEGEQLTPDQVKDFEQQAKNIFKSQADLHANRISSFTELSKRAGVDERDVILDLTIPEEFRSNTDSDKEAENFLSSLGA